MLDHMNDVNFDTKKYRYRTKWHGPYKNWIREAK